MLHKKNIFAAFLIACMAFYFSGCVKDTKVKPSIQNYTPPVALSDYCFFKPGTWWLYQDSISGAKDSVYVAAGSVQTYTVGPNDGKDYTGTFHHYYTKTIDGIGDEREYDIYDEDAAQSAKCCGGRYYCEVHWNRPPKQSQAGIYFGSYTHIFNVFTNGVTGGGGFSGNYGEQCWARGKQPDIQVSGVVYSNVCVFQTSYAEDFLTNYMKFNRMNYFSKNIGIIKSIDLDSNRTWLLISCHIAN